MAAAERVKLYIPPARIGEEDVVVGHQGKLYQIPRGQEVEVPLAVKEEYERGVRATTRRYENAKRMKEAGNI